MRAVSLFHLRWVELVHDQPRARRLSRRVWAVPILEDDAPEAQSGERLAPRPQPARHVRGEPDVRARRHDALEMPLALEQWDADEIVAVDLEHIERAEDLAVRELAGERVPLWVHLEIVVILPVGDEHAVEDRGLGMRLGLD